MRLFSVSIQVPCQYFHYITMLSPNSHSGLITTKKNNNATVTCAREERKGTERGKKQPSKAFSSQWLGLFNGQVPLHIRPHLPRFQQLIPTSRSVLPHT